jgi:hypothetical protein
MYINTQFRGVVAYVGERVVWNVPSSPSLHMYIYAYAYAQPKTKIISNATTCATKIKIINSGNERRANVQLERHLSLASAYSRSICWTRSPAPCTLLTAPMPCPQPLCTQLKRRVLNVRIPSFCSPNVLPRLRISSEIHF